MLLCPARACHRQAAAPAIIGLAKEVPPSKPKIPLPKATNVPEPCVHTLGFTLPSNDGPCELKSAIISCESTPPIVSTLSPSAGAPIYLHGVLPELPALFTTRIPLDAAMSAAIVITALLPFI